MTSVPLGWTAADAAELDVLAWTLVDAYWSHRPGCPACSSGRPCKALRAAIDEVSDWTTRRELLSRAEHLRTAQTAKELAA